MKPMQASLVFFIALYAKNKNTKAYGDFGEFMHNPAI